MPTEKNPETVYWDTNVFSFYFDTRSTYKLYRDFTRDWWQKRRHDFYVCTSVVAQYELEDGNYAHQNEALDFMKKVAIFPINDEIEEIAAYYIERYLAPKEKIELLRGDALHMAVCAFYKIDYLLTWNQKHLANVNKLRQLRLMNAKLGLATPEIITPAQLIY